MFNWSKKARLNKKIIAAVREGDIRLTGELLEAGANIEMRDPNTFDMPLLSLAAYKGHIEVLKLLLDKGADMKSLDRDGDMPVANAVNGNHAGTLAELLARGAA